MKESIGQQYNNKLKEINDRKKILKKLLNHA